MQSTQSFYLAPGNLDLVVVSGADAVKLLQGQLTCDVESLTEDSFTRGAACNNKGRIYATFVLVRHADAFFLVFNEGVGSVFAAALKKFLPFYKCSLQLMPPEWACLACAGPAARVALEAEVGTLPLPDRCAALPNGWLCRLGEEQVLACVDPAGQAVLSAALDSAVPRGEAEDWQRWELLAGHFPFTAEDVEKYTPQELHLDTRGYVSFSKGCYTGQEIVARMHYRGKVKKQLHLLSMEAGDASGPLDEVSIHDEHGVVVSRPLKGFRSDSGTLLLLAPLPVESATASLQLHEGAGHQLVARVF